MPPFVLTPPRRKPILRVPLPPRSALSVAVHSGVGQLLDAAFREWSQELVVKRVVAKMREASP